MPPQIRHEADVKPDDLAISSINNNGVIGTPSAGWQTTIGVVPEQLHSLLHSYGITGRKKTALLVGLSVLLSILTLVVVMYIFHRGFRRTCQFWSRALPWIVEYHCIKFHSHYIVGRNETEWEKIQHDYHALTAPKAVLMVQEFGGVYVKLGQALSTMGSGLLPEEYVQALRPLQDGVAPRDYKTISAIIEKSTGQKMADIFESFEETPIGAATIGQAHRAVLKQPKSSSPTQQKQVIVKVQYPEVAALFDADFRNLEWLVMLIMPHRSHDQLRNARKRHELEMDFRQEATNLRECAANMQRHGLEPSQVRIPRVIDEQSLCTKEVLVMEYLKGVSLRDVMEEEQDRIARALGKQNAEELRYMIAKQIKEHFERGGGDARGGSQMKLLLGGANRGRMARVWNALGPFAVHGLRRYARVRDQVTRFVARINRRSNSLTIRSSNNDKPNKARTRHVNLGKALKTLIHVHAVQVMQDGVYNQDPHPGNVLILEDGRLGLLDYGMVGRLSDKERQNVAETVLALANNDPQEVARVYLREGYHVTWKGERVTDPNILHRLSSTHLDKVDLTPITVTDNAGGMTNVPKTMEIQDLFVSLDVHHVPDWLVQTRRVGRLMMGVSAQAARPISLANEWRPVAKLAVQEASTKPSLTV
ncbi:protein kinase UbiB [Seminavis robusta]|uniref:Protein kinase UbiB n=1 Tax=Seminavis robusta TaxID=568900 RepID=A0A9N8DS41_9STRA|nr:protein kinase UbiB [Seminavis robusta]|eukprot:Sro312_g114660.1 protein kinase UbiB (648) ;mRNA; r:52795-55032